METNGGKDGGVLCVSCTTDPPEQLQSSLTSLSLNPTGRLHTMFQKSIPSPDVLMKVVGTVV